MTIVTRFAPSPTGLLHLGHAHAALFAEARAHEAAGESPPPTEAPGGRFLLRIEDIDRTRCRGEFEAALIEDLGWLGLSWETPVRRQSAHMDDYAGALRHLETGNLVYPCFCTRLAIAAEIAAAAAAPHGPDGPIYPGTCRALADAERRQRIAAGIPYALRLDVARAARQTGPLAWTDRAKGEQAARPEIFGDVVLARKETPTSYHLAVTVDDALQGVTLVTRGEDLFAATHVHRLLQALLGLPTPAYHHHPLLADAHGRRFAKRDRALTLRALRESGRAPEDVRALAGF
ncbi:MAG: tRNA glutamyl-Q(34) synthetase GluQRS [Rhodospirillales bacterium]|nr:tRNA glutamyl-Q(34) synthetase GluQRS [Rhodospirillales bacterium]MSP79890.1 tRNA glutamyl-Q(34) synthetase GluQRS [Rhodospirillales bacterium]